jgi:hypothetical protein
LTIEKLKGNRDTLPSNNSDASDIQGPCKKQKKGNNKSDDDALRKDALQVGKEFAVLHTLWTDPGAISYVALLNNNGSEGDLSDESDSDKEVRAKAKVIYDMLPAHLRMHVRKPWSKELNCNLCQNLACN